MSRRWRWNWNSRNGKIQARSAQKYAMRVMNTGGITQRRNGRDGYGILYSHLVAFVAPLRDQGRLPPLDSVSQQVLSKVDQKAEAQVVRRR